MHPDRRVVFWRRTDIAGLERLELSRSEEGIIARGTLLSLEDGGLQVAHRWRLTPDWHVLRSEVERVGSGEPKRLVMERAGEGWTVDGVRRADLDGAQEPDLSATPFCNSFPIRRMSPQIGSWRTLDVCFVDASTMTVRRSRQTYTRLEPRRFRFTNPATDFRAELEVDDEGLILSYEHLFERVRP